MVPCTADMKALMLPSMEDANLEGSTETAGAHRPSASGLDGVMNVFLREREREKNLKTDIL